MFRLSILLRKRRNQVSEIGDFVFGAVGALLTIQHRLRRGFDRKKRSQDRECLRRKRERNDYRDYCTSHPRGTILAKELGHFGVVALPAFVMTHCAGLFGSSCLKTGHDYGVQKDCRKHDLIGATPPSLADRIECLLR